MRLRHDWASPRQYSHASLEECKELLVSKRKVDYTNDELDALLSEVACDDEERPILKMLAQDIFFEDDLEDDDGKELYSGPPGGLGSYVDVARRMPEDLWVNYDRDVHDLALLCSKNINDERVVADVRDRLAAYQNGFAEDECGCQNALLYALKSCTKQRGDSTWQRSVLRAQLLMESSQEQLGTTVNDGSA